MRRMMEEDVTRLTSLLVGNISLVYRGYIVERGYGRGPTPGSWLGRHNRGECRESESTCWAAATGGSTANCWASYMRTGAKGTGSWVLHARLTLHWVQLGQLGDVESVRN